VSNSTRSTSSSYDERYVVPLEASRRGAHRARVSPVMAVLPVVAVVGIVVGAIALVYAVFGGLGDGPETAAPAGSTPAATSSAATGGATAPAESSPAASQEVSPTASVSAGEVDLTIPVAVFNGSGTTGLGFRGADKLKAAGWTVGEPQTWKGGAVRTTTVFYGTAAQRASALAIVKALGKGSAKLSAAKAGTGITAVIGPDFPGAKPRASAGPSRTPAPSATGGATKPSTTPPPSSSPAAQTPPA
jgi:hypothetical protein